MNASVPKAERSWVGKTEFQAERFGVGSPVRMEAALKEAKDIARAEMARQRRRLGSLTREQEAEVEHLLMVTVATVSEVARRVLDAMPIMP